ncbi:MAG TPA: secretin N-terminal domain-containing protein [Sedimentisphaerales bacterium]|nr:secretin N-terminal domain-containing protein [Sedimentisphaerales bacterium]
MSKIINNKNLTIYLGFFLVISQFALGNEISKEGFDPFISNIPDTEENISQQPQDSGPTIPQVQFNNSDISMVFQIISDATGWSIFPTEAVSSAKVSFWAKNVTALNLLDTTINNAGFIYHRNDKVIRVMTYDEYMQNFGLAQKVFLLKFAKAVSIEAAIKPFLSKLAKSVIHKETNSIVLYESSGNLKFIEEIITALDTPAEDTIIEVIALKYVKSTELAKVLQLLFSENNLQNQNTNKITTEPASENIVVQSTTAIYSVEQTNQLVIIAAEKKIEKIKEIINKVDIYDDNILLEVMDLNYADCEQIAQTLQQLFNDDKKNDTSKNTFASNNSHQELSADRTQYSTENTTLSPQSQVQVFPIARTNQLVIQAVRSDAERIESLIKKLDKYVEPITKNYQFIYVDTSEIFSGLEQIVGLSGQSNRSQSGKGDATANGVNRSGITLVEKTNSILLTGPPAVHRIMTSIVESIDKPSSYEAGMIRIYKLENADVDEVAKTISELIQQDQDSTDKTEKTANAAKFADKDSPSATVDNNTEMAETEEFVPKIEARVSVSKSTNSIVVQATARQHRELEKLINQLDIRRKQVLIEAMIVEISQSDDLNLGVELSSAFGDGSIFSSFGLSTGLDTTSGTRNITVSPGGTASIFSPASIQMIIQALKSEGKARISSSPQILVNDNAAGFINSIAEEPTTQTNQGETTTTTSFAGFVEAGTQFTITPHISEKDYLRVEYQITLNSFGAKPTDPSIPPPRNTSSIQSEATVPNGHTIVVGGLQTSDEVENVDKIPMLGDIPVVGWAFKKTIKEKQHKTTYLFITPIIMESDNFNDLKDISDKKIEEIKPNEEKK